VFSIFKKKPKLASLIPQGFIDIHNHVLPGIDDGARNLQDTQQLLAGMHALGIKKCIGTPHTLQGVWNNTTATIQDAWHSVDGIASLEGHTHLLRAASEYMIDNSLLERIQNKVPLLPLHHQKVLVEMSYQSPPLGLFDILFELQLQGYEVVLAHPERYYFYHNQFAQYEKLKQSRIQFQINLLSVTGYYGKDVALVAGQLLKEGYIDFAGTDIHHQRHVDYFQQPVMLQHTAPLIEAMERNALFG
jgi:tyrosine-protein phosphatase YwqE